MACSGTSKKEEAGDAIKAVIAENSYAPEFVIVKEQVVATIASSFILHLDEIKNNLEKKNLKKAKQETENLKTFEKSEELKDFFSDKKNQKKVIEATESINAVIAQYVMKTSKTIMSFFLLIINHKKKI